MAKEYMVRQSSAGEGILELPLIIRTRKKWKVGNAVNMAIGKLSHTCVVEEVQEERSCLGLHNFKLFCMPTVK